MRLLRVVLNFTPYFVTVLGGNKREVGEDKRG
jgi:hypothetical protein